MSRSHNRPPEAGNSLSPACFIGLDCGTTNTRAWLVEGTTAVESRRIAVGIRDSVARGRELLLEALAGPIAELRRAATERGAQAQLVAAAGMITSEHGLAEVPHLPAPAGLDELAAAMRRYELPGLTDLPVYLVPGVRTGDPAVAPEEIGATDVMRGEETLVVGLIRTGGLGQRGLLLNLGSHWKQVWLDERGRIAGSRTSLSGELLHTVQTNTLLAASVPGGRPEEIDLAWARLGVDAARREGLERALFDVRLLQQRTRSSEEDRLSYLAGAFVGSTLPHLLQQVGTGCPIVLAGGGPIAEIFVDALGREGREASVLSAEEVEAGTITGLRTLLGRVGTPFPGRLDSV